MCHFTKFPQPANSFALGIFDGVVIFYLDRSVLPGIDTIKPERQWVSPETPNSPPTRRNLPIDKIRTRGNQVIDLHKALRKSAAKGDSFHIIIIAEFPYKKFGHRMDLRKSCGYLYFLHIKPAVNTKREQPSGRKPKETPPSSSRDRKSTSKSDKEEKASSSQPKAKAKPKSPKR